MEAVVEVTDLVAVVIVVDVLVALGGAVRVVVRFSLFPRSTASRVRTNSNGYKTVVLVAPANPPAIMLDQNWACRVNTMPPLLDDDGDDDHRSSAGCTTAT